MKTKKIKVFLGGYVNVTNAQNLNCLALAKYLDKDNFECAAMTLFSGNLTIDGELDGVKLIKCRNPHRIWKYISYLHGIMWCDVAYLPKREVWEFCAKCLKWLGKKSFTTVEGVIDGTNLDKAIIVTGSREAIVKSCHFTNITYAITKFMAEKNNKLLGIKSDGVLYLGVETDNFQPKPRHRETLGNIAFIGNNIRYKGIDDYFGMAEKFQNITFHIVGGGIGYDVSAEIEKRKLINVVYHGLMTHKQMAELLQNIDLHIFPSRSEGFPKVTLETAAMGVPSIVYSDYGATEWITTGKNGYVVSTIDEIEAVIKHLQQHPEKLDILAEEAIKLAKSFDWKVLVQDWEKVIEGIWLGE